MLLLYCFYFRSSASLSGLTGNHGMPIRKTCQSSNTDTLARTQTDRITEKNRITCKSVWLRITRAISTLTLHAHYTTLKPYASCKIAADNLHYLTMAKYCPSLGNIAPSLCINRYIAILFPIHQSSERNRTEPLLIPKT